MRLNPDILRDLLLKIEEDYPAKSGKLTFPDLKGTSEEEVAYHCLLAWEAGFIEAIDITTFAHHFRMMAPRRLTFGGSEYLSNIRDPLVWKKTKEGAQKIGSVSVETISELAKGFIKTQVKRLTGLDTDI
jgi:hypothetical protein